MRSMLSQHINCNNEELIYSATYREPKNFLYVFNSENCITNIKNFWALYRSHYKWFLHCYS